MYRKLQYFHDIRDVLLWERDDHAELIQQVHTVRLPRRGLPKRDQVVFS